MSQNSAKRLNLASGRFRVTLDQLKQLVLTLAPQQRNALEFEGTPVLIPTDNGMELRVLKDGQLLVPTVLQATQRARQVENLVRQVKARDKPDPIDYRIRKAGIVERSDYDRAYANLKTCEQYQEYLNELIVIMDSYMPMDEYDKRLVAFVKKVAIPLIAKLLETYVEGVAFRQQSFPRFFEKETVFSNAILRLVSVKPDLANNPLKRVFFPRRITAWFSVKLSAFQSEYWNDIRSIIGYADRIEEAYNKYDLDAVYQDCKHLLEEKKYEEELYLILPPDVPLKDTWKSRTAFPANWANLNAPKGPWEAMNMGLLNPALIISGLRMGVTNDILANFFVGKKYFEIKEDSLMAKPNASLEGMTLASKSWGQILNLRKKGSVEVKASDQLAVEVKQVTPVDKGTDASVAQVAKVAPLKLFNKDSIDNKLLAEAKVKIEKPKTLNFELVAPLESQLILDVKDVFGTQPIANLVVSFLRSLPRPLQRPHWDRIHAIWQGQNPLEVEEDEANHQKPDEEVYEL